MWRFKRWHRHRQSGRLRQQNRQLNTRPKTRAQSGSQDYILILYPSVQPGKKLISVHRLNFGRFREGRSRTKIGTAFDRPPPPSVSKIDRPPFCFRLVLCQFVSSDHNTSVWNKTTPMDESQRVWGALDIFPN